MSQEQLTVAEANRRLYADLAERYDEGSDWADPKTAQRLHDVLQQSVALLGDEPRVLDACGGSGRASLTLMDMGLRPLTVDLSPEMLAVYERKARAAGHEPVTKVAEIESFLRDSGEDYDLIVFASALHHMADYMAVVDLAYDRLAPGGVLASVFDPARTTRLGTLLRRVDYVLHVILHETGRVPGLLLKRLRRLAGRGGHGEHAGHDAPDIGAIAERHALSGVDDIALERALVQRGAEVVAHPRYEGGRFAFIRALVRRIGQASAFSLIVRKPR